MALITRSTSGGRVEKKRAAGTLYAPRRVGGDAVCAASLEGPVPREMVGGTDGRPRAMASASCPSCPLVSSRAPAPATWSPSTASTWRWWTPRGALVAHAGDAGLVTFWRSASKAFQALPLVQDGAADAYGYGPRELALACASHSSEPVHRALALKMLAAAGNTEAQLACGPHPPALPGGGGGRPARGGDPHAALEQLLGQARGHARARAPPGLAARGLRAPGPPAAGAPPGRGGALERHAARGHPARWWTAARR